MSRDIQRPEEFANDRRFEDALDLERQRRSRASRMLRAAVARGDVTRQPCEECGEPKVDGHHEDYDQPYQVRWLCRAHHLARHSIRPRNVLVAGAAAILRAVDEALPTRSDEMTVSLRAYSLTFDADDAMLLRMANDGSLRPAAFVGGGWWILVPSRDVAEALAQPPCEYECEIGVFKW
jgi:hypothetical protein